VAHLIAHQPEVRPALKHRHRGRVPQRVGFPVQEAGLPEEPPPHAPCEIPMIQPAAGFGGEQHRDAGLEVLEVPGQHRAERRRQPDEAWLFVLDGLDPIAVGDARSRQT